MIRATFVLLLLLCLAACTSPPKKVERKGMDPDAIKGVVRTNVAQIRECWSAALKRDPDLDGKMVLRWEIGDTGSVTSTKVLQPLEQDADSCIASAVKSWKFPPPPKGEVGVVEFPFPVPAPSEE